MSGNKHPPMGNETNDGAFNDDDDNNYNNINDDYDESNIINDIANSKKPLEARMFPYQGGQPPYKYCKGKKLKFGPPNGSLHSTGRSHQPSSQSAVSRVAPLTNANRTINQLASSSSLTNSNYISDINTQQNSVLPGQFLPNSTITVETNHPVRLAIGEFFNPMHSYSANDACRYEQLDPNGDYLGKLYERLIMRREELNLDNIALIDFDDWTLDINKWYFSRSIPGGNSDIYRPYDTFDIFECNYVYGLTVVGKDGVNIVSQIPKNPTLDIGFAFVKRSPTLNESHVQAIRNLHSHANVKYLALLAPLSHAEMVRSVNIA